MNPESLFSLSEHLERLSKDGDPLEVLDATVAFEYFRGWLVEGLGYGDGAKGGRPPFDRVSMFKVLIVQAHPPCHRKARWRAGHPRQDQPQRTNSRRGHHIGPAEPGRALLQQTQTLPQDRHALRQNGRQLSRLHSNRCGTPMGAQLVNMT